MSSVEAITQTDFDTKVLKAKHPVLVDFWAEWCGPCRNLGPILDEVAEELGGDAKIVKVNVDENPELAQKYGIRGIPTMIFFKDGEVAKSLVGLQSKEDIAEGLKALFQT